MNQWVGEWGGSVLAVLAVKPGKLLEGRRLVDLVGVILRLATAAARRRAEGSVEAEAASTSVVGDILVDWGLVLVGRELEVVGWG